MTPGRGVALARAPSAKLGGVRWRRRGDTAELAGLTHQVRIEQLAANLETCGPLAVRETVVRRGGERLELHLDDGSVLRLRLFWPRREEVAALCSVRWDDDIGWVTVVTTAAGERRVDYAWLAELTPAAG